MSRRRSDAAVVLLGVAPLAALLTYAWLGIYSRYLADDFGTELSIAKHGFFGAQAISYREWSGRVASTFFSSAFALFGPSITPAVCALLLILWSITSERAIAAIVPQLGWRWRWLLALGFVWACCDGAVAIFQSLFWQTGAITYVLPLVFLSACIATLNSEKSHAGLTGGLAFLASASSEILAVTATFAALVTVALSRGSTRRRAIAALIGAAAGLLIVAAAPGNAIRRAHFQSPPPLIREIELTMTSSLQYCSRFYERAAIPAIVVLFVFALAGTIAVSPRAGKRLAGIWLVAAAAIGLAHFIGVHTGLGVPPGRGLLTIDVFVFAAFAWTGFEIGGALTQPWPKGLLAAGVVVCIVSGPSVSVVRNVALVPMARAFAQRWDAIDARLRASRGQSVVLDVPVTVGGLLWVTPYPNHPVNRTIAEYYGLKSVVTRP